MKKLFAVCTALCLLLVAAGCGKSNNAGTAAVAAGAAHSSISVEKMNLGNPVNLDSKMYEGEPKIPILPPVHHVDVVAADLLPIFPAKQG